MEVKYDNFTGNQDYMISDSSIDKINARFIQLHEEIKKLQQQNDYLKQQIKNITNEFIFDGYTKQEIVVCATRESLENICFKLLKLEKEI